MDSCKKIALGGGCHWCTEAVFQSLAGVITVEQGFVKQQAANSTFSEAVVVTYDSLHISLQDLVEVHLYTHKSTADHSMRAKYRSAIYAFDQNDFEESVKILKVLQADFDKKLVTQVLFLEEFKSSEAGFRNYYRSNPEKPFCETYIVPKLELLQRKFPEIFNDEEIAPKRNRELI